MRSYSQLSHLNLVKVYQPLTMKEGAADDNNSRLEIRIDGSAHIQKVHGRSV